MPDVIDLSATRELSRCLLGGLYRIEVGAAIAGTDGLVCMVDVIRELGDPPGKSAVNAEFKILEKAGMLLRPDGRRGGRIYLLRKESAYWEMCQRLRDETSMLAQG